MVAIPLIRSGQHRIGLFERFMAWIGDDVAAEPKPGRSALRSPSAPRRAAFLEHAAMSREMHRL
jgi:hypothetical protein